MRAALRSRLERLEVVVEPKKPPLFRAGYLKTLPADYVGERHVVIVKREPPVPPGTVEWCEFEERPGPAPLKALEKWLPDETKPHKGLLPEWLVDDLRQQGIRFDASGLPEKSSLQEKAAERIEPATPAPSPASQPGF